MDSQEVVAKSQSPDKTRQSPSRPAIVGQGALSAINLGLNFNIRLGKQYCISELIKNHKKEYNRVTKSNVHKLERFKKVAVIKEFIFDEQDESNSHNNIYENLDGSLQ